ncbi:Zn-dependent metalloprotease [Allocatelliglobosispora scoriae]|uniref:Zn-dependent metalloprotease n=1 Tax=Allocatelliglobosispora scoriae TaxID=643052 RepID=A0A841BJA6_9ACTN|nr:M4 family metallopeptidase [Allocatelliglobosispora scoriae]MBB5866981.1 Zn-dependent metalloprotease [Allocatelliglobosispora scoriae]
MRRTLAAAGGTLLIAAMLTSVATSSASGASIAPDRSASAISAATQALQQHGSAVKAATGDAYAAGRAVTDADGSAHVRYTRTHQGLRVYGGDFVIHTAPGGAFTGASSGLQAPLALSTTPKVAAADATATARKAFTGTITGVAAQELFIDASTGTGRLAWETTVAGWARDGVTPSKLHVITDALTGDLVGSFDEVETVIGTGNSMYSGTVAIDTTLTTPPNTYSLIDPSHGNNRTCSMGGGTGACTTMTDTPDNVWGNGLPSNPQTAGVDAHFGSAKTYDYFKNVHGRCGIFGACAGVTSRVHYSTNYVNAFWDGTQMTYGDGSGNVKPLTSLDVAGHEMSHGVTEALAGLVYSGESGGLNEATSDIFGNMVEFYAGVAADPGDYNVGEKIDIFGTGQPLRYMYNPPLDGSSHGCWSTSTNSVDVHYSSGVGNHFFFNLANGTGATPYGTSPICAGAPAVVGIGRNKAENIWYRALDVYFTSTTKYINTATPANTARAYTLQAAKDLYGNCSVEHKAVNAAWAAVNVPGSDGCSGPVAGSLLWLRADLGVTTSAGKVSAWADQSGTAHHATMVTAARQPTLVTGALNGLPVVRFGGAQSLNLANIAPTAFTIFVVGKNSLAAESFSMILGPGGSNPNNQLRWENGTQALVYGSNGLGTTTATIGNTRVYHDLIIRYDGATIRVYRDNALISSTAVSGASAWNINQIGAYYSSYFMTGDLAEIVAYSSALSDADRTTTANYLKTKYALP